MTKGLFIAALFVISSISTLKAQIEPLLLHKASQDSVCRQWVESALNEMSLKEKIGQLFVYTIAPVQTKANITLLHKAVNTHKIGGLLFSGGETTDQVTLTNHAQEMSKVPLMITFDGEWGLSMRLRNTPAFPKNMVLGCIQDNQLIHEYGKEVARQCREIGVHVNFAPVADVNINPKNPVINVRSFGEVPTVVAEKVVAYASGLESGGVLSASKHFPGHGDTDTDSHKSLPVLPFTRGRLDSVEIYPFRKAVEAGLGGIMVGHLHAIALDYEKNKPSSLSYNVVQKVLKEELAFRGLIFTDALVMKGVSSSSNICLQALKAGNDMVLSPPQLGEEINGILKGIENGEISEEEITQKCRKVLTYKYALGMSNRQNIDLTGLENRINSPQTRDLIRRLNQAAVTVLSNKNETLPLEFGTEEIAVLNVWKPGSSAIFTKALEKYARPKRFQLRRDMTEVAQKKLCDSLSVYKHTIVCITGDELTSYQRFFEHHASGLPLIYVFFTSKDAMLRIEGAIEKASTVIVGHSANESVQTHVSDILFGKATADGRLSASVGKLFRAGDGLTILPPQTAYQAEVFKPSINLERLDSINFIAQEGIAKGAYPGCQIVVLKDGKTVYDKCFGTHAGIKSEEVKPTDIYDIASLSKTAATLLAVMKLYDKKLIALTDKLSDHLPVLRGTNKEHITIKEVLFHQSGLPSTISFYKKAIDENSYKGPLFSNKRTVKHTVRISAGGYAPSNLRLKKEWVSKAPDDEYTIRVCDDFWLNKSFKDFAMQQIIDEPLRDKRYRYSCVGFILLQQLAEQVSGMSLDTFLAQEFYEPMHLERTTYLPLLHFPKENIVPSSKDMFIRKTTIHGYVHDESAAFLGGVSGNAGLFSSARDMARLHQMLLNEGELDGHRYLSEETCRLFATETSPLSHRGLGYNKPNPQVPAKNPCPKSAPTSVYGHTGFTGSCAWVDPENKLVYVFLSNRIYPNVWVNELSKLNIRERIQDMIYKSL